MIQRLDWSRLTTHQVGRYAEYFVKMELTLFGFEVFNSEVDDRGVDFVTRRNGGLYYEVQVKSVRLKNTSGYIFFPKSKFALRPGLLAALVLLYPSCEPELFLIPSEAWLTPNAVLINRDYDGLKSAPEWGVNVSERNRHLLLPYLFETSVETL